MKPRGVFSGLMSPFSVRMPEAMRKELELSAKRRSRATRRTWSVGQELLLRLRYSFNREQDESRDPSARALNFLFAELADRVHLGLAAANSINWRSDPFVFRAFKLAVGKLLDALEPPGDVKRPPDFMLEMLKGDKTQAMEWFIQITRSPEAMAEQAVAYVLMSFNKPVPFHEWFGDTDSKSLRVAAEQKKMEQSYYGMIDAKRDLQIKAKGAKR
jgi:hypothetical protein